jgi:two-component system chemotaxis sensor kinase CheA
VVEDDGGGVDTAGVAARAGRPPPTSDAELLHLLATPGLSIRDRADATSGRGMGVDIVRRVVEVDLGGQLTMINRPGQGTAFRLLVPVTIAVVDAFAFRCGAQRYLAPVATVEELIEVAAHDVVAPPSAPDAAVRSGLLRRRGAVLQFIELIEALGGPRREGRSPKAIVVRRDDRHVAFGVDSMQGHHEIVVRPVTDPLVSARGVMGASDLGDGRPTLVLDLAVLATDGSEKAA